MSNSRSRTMRRNAAMIGTTSMKSASTPSIGTLPVLDGTRVPVIARSPFSTVAVRPSALHLLRSFRPRLRGQRRASRHRRKRAIYCFGNSCLLDDHAPFGDVLRHALAHLFRRARARFEPEPQRSFLKIGLRDALVGSPALSVRMTSAGIAGACLDAVPARHDVVRQAAFLCRRYVFQQRDRAARPTSR